MYLTAFFVYFSILLLLAYVFHKKQTTASSFIVGNRSLNFWLVALSAHASDMSSWLFMAFPMLIFTAGLSSAWIAIGLLVGMFLNWHFIASRLRIMTEHYNTDTLALFFEKRFNDTKGTICLVSALAMVIFLTHYLSAGLIAMGNLFESLFGIDYLIGISIALLVVVIYTFIGGFTTVAWTDLFQGLFLLLVILAVPFMAFLKINGWEEIAQISNKRNISLSLVSFESTHSFIFSMTSSLLLAVGWGLGYFGMPHILNKFMSINNASDLKKSKWLGISWQFLALGGATLVGLVAIAYFPNGLEKPELVFIEMVKDLVHPLLVGFILCGIIAANMSTMDSQILVCSSIISRDLYNYFFSAQLSDKKVLKISKLCVILVALVALILASNKSSTIANTVSYSWSGLGSAFGPLVLMSLYSRRTNKYGALAGIIVGASVVMIWPTIKPFVTQHDVMAIIPGFIFSLISIYTISWLTSKQTAEFHDLSNVEVK